MGNEAVKVGKMKNGDQDDGITILTTGIKARLVPVGASLIDDVVAQVKNPKVPVFFDEKKGREEENPNDPDYIQACTDATRQRNMAAMDAMILFGMILVDPLPEDNIWLQKLQWLQKRSVLNLDEYNLEDKFDLEFLYKRYIACGTIDLITLGRKAGLNKEDIEEAARSFKS
jgi:hypothetical protein